MGGDPVVGVTRMDLLDAVRSHAAEEYATFLERLDASRGVGAWITLYAPDDLEERNETFEVQDCLPGWFTIGDDGGGVALLMRLDRSGAVYRCGHGALGAVEPERVADSFSAWLDEGCPASWMDGSDAGEL